MKVSILSIGNELLSGRTINTNANWLGNRLTKMGCRVEKQVVVPDEEKPIINALNFLANDKEGCIIVTGGLGPTDDDITREVLFKYVKTESKFDQDYWNKLSKKFKKLGIDIPDSNRDQALVPQNGDVIDNYDEIYQTYEESEYEIGEYVDEMINVNDYEDFVLNGGNLSDLFQDIEERAEEGFTTIEDVVAPYGPDIALGDLINHAFNSAYVGELIYNDISAIGGETTGSVIVLNQGGIVEVDFGRADYLHDRASELNNQTVVIEGHLEMVEGIEIPNRTIVQARTIFGTPELESLQLALETIDLSSSLAIAEALEENGLT